MANQISVTLDTASKAVIATAPNGSLAAPLAWTLVSGDASINAAADGNSCEILSGTTAGAIVVTVTDGILTGEVDLTETVAVVQATDLGLSATVVPK